MLKRSVLIAAAVVGSLAHLLRRRLLRPTSACQPADRQGNQHQDSSSTSELTAAAAQQAVLQLQDVYVSMANSFSAHGLDLEAIGETAAWFETGPPAPWPRRYSSFTPHPLPPGSVRLVVVPLADNCPRLASTAAAAAADILSLLPPGCKVFSNARQNLHITVFHFSHPVDTRPDAISPCSGLAHCLAAQPDAAAAAGHQQGSQQEHQSQQQPANSSLGNNSNMQHLSTAVSASPQQQQPLVQQGLQQRSAVQAVPAASGAALPPVHERPGPTAQQLAAEQAAAAAIAAATPPFALQFERVLLARSGVLLLTWSDPSGALTRLRGNLHSRFPGACSKQSSIIHTSLFRIVETPASCSSSSSSAGATDPGQQQQQLGQLSAAGVASILAVCERWTQQLQGMRLSVSTLWWVNEEEFSSIQGPRLPLTCSSKVVLH